MASEEEIRRDLNERFERLKKGNPEIPFETRVRQLASKIKEEKPGIYSWETIERIYGLSFTEDERDRIKRYWKRIFPPKTEITVGWGITIPKMRGEGSSSPVSLQNCIDVRVTPEENIEIRFKDIPTCEPVKADYEKVLRTALMGAETIYKTLPKK